MFSVNNLILILFLFIAHFFIVTNGTRTESLELTKYGPRKVKVELHGNCSSFSLCYNSTLFGKNLPWKLSKRFKFGQMFNGTTTSEKCGENAREIMFSMDTGRVSVGNENYMFEPAYQDNITYYDEAPPPTIELNFMISGKFLLINNGAAPTPTNFGTEFFAQSKLGTFLAEYAALWLLAADIVTKFSDKSTTLYFMVPDQCEFVQIHQSTPQQCLTFDNIAFDQRYHHRGVRHINPLITNGAQISILYMPWTVYFVAVLPRFEYRCTASLISPNFVLLAAHCFEPTTEFTSFFLGFGSNSRNIFDKKYDGDRVKMLRVSDSNVFIHPNYNAHQLGTHDLALIKLEEAVNPTSTVSPVCIHCGSTKKFKSGNAYIAGWGLTEDESTCRRHYAAEGPMHLMGRMANLTECSSLDLDDRTRLCVERNTVQQGDSGGPLLANNGTNFVQIGVTSTVMCNQFFGTSMLSIYSPLDGCWIEKISGVQCGF